MLTLREIIMQKREIAVYLVGGENVGVSADTVSERNARSAGEAHLR